MFYCASRRRRKCNVETSLSACLNSLISSLSFRIEKLWSYYLNYFRFQLNFFIKKNNGPCRNIFNLQLFIIVFGGRKYKVFLFKFISFIKARDF